jgi:hypothetical protein
LSLTPHESTAAADSAAATMPMQTLNWRRDVKDRINNGLWERQGVS